MKAKNTEPLEINGIRLGPELTEEQAKAIFALGEQAVVFALLAQAKIIADRNGDQSGGSRRDDPSCPSGQKAPYERPDKKGRKRKPGGKQGHEGHGRAKPDHMDHREQHRESHCPDCGGQLTPCHISRQRYIEDIPQGVHVEAVEHTIHRDRCPRCRKRVEPKVPDALPNSTVGNRLLAMSAWLHYALGTTISRILSVFNSHLPFPVTSGGLVQMWHRLAEILKSWYEEIAAEIVQAGVLHADETGWRINGRLGWLWCFTTPTATLFALERSRASPVVLKFITEQSAGVLVSGFWAAYNILVCVKQKCLVHLLRDLERVETYQDTSGDWARFAKKLRRLIRDAIRLRQRREERAPATCERRYHRIEQRLQQLQGMKLGAARQQAPGAWRLVHVEVDAAAAAAPDHGHTSSNGGPDVVETLGQEHRFRPRQGGSNPRIREVGLALPSTVWFNAVSPGGGGKPGSEGATPIIQRFRLKASRR